MEIRTIQDAIASHAFWKVSLRQAISSGKIPSSLRDAVNAHDCDLGRWLDRFQESSMALQKAKEAHNAFHQAAARILRLIENGDIESAKASMSLQGDFFYKICGFDKGITRSNDRKTGHLTVLALMSLGMLSYTCHVESL